MRKTKGSPEVNDNDNGAVAIAEPDESGRPGRAPAKILIPAPDVQWLDVRVIGDTPLICNAFPDKLKRQMIEDRESEPGTRPKPAKKNRPKRDFDREFQDSLYPLPDDSGYGFPAIAFKRALVGACRFVDGLPMTEANRLIFVEPAAYSKGAGVVRIDGRPIKREDMVRLKGMTKPPDIRYRGEFREWSCTLRIRIIAPFLTPTMIFNLVQWAGLTEGVGEFRPSSPEKSGDCGTFHPAHVGDDR